ncbi:MAG: cupredoxin domain-containing protein [Gemmatimonadota bacterium]
MTSASLRGGRARLVASLLAGVLAGSTPAAGQSLMSRTPNMGGTTVPRPRSSEFTFLHRFELTGEDEKVINYPTLVLAVGLPAGFALGTTYASNSELGAGTPNEWEPWVKLRRAFGERFDLAGTAAYNTATESANGELTGRLRLGPVSLLGVARAFSSAYGGNESEAALGGGLLLHLTPRLAVGGDVARIVSADTFASAWSAGAHVAIPGSPHTLGLVVSNVGATTLEGASRGFEDIEGDTNLRYGFAFTMPLGTFSQWARIFHGEEESTAENLVVLRDFSFGPAEIRIRAGETVRWVNDDPVAHTVTADDGSFDSDLLENGEGFSRRFDDPGRYPYHCTPHPFMTGLVVVEAD